MKNLLDGAAAALAATLSFAAPNAALAQSQSDAGQAGHQGMSGGHGEMSNMRMQMEGIAGNEAVQAYMQAMEEMTEKMNSMEMSSDPGVAFAQMMIPHHQSAVDMAEAYLEHGDDPQLKAIAQAIMDIQPAEIKALQKWLQKNGQSGSTSSAD